MRSAGGTIDPQAVKLANGQVLADGSGVSVGGWTIITHKGPIATDSEMASVKQQLGGVMAIPEQCFLDNKVEITHQETGLSIKFTALDALHGWLADTSERIQVQGSHQWLHSRQKEVEAHSAKTIDYDWTFTTDYAGTTTAPSSWQETTTDQIDMVMLTARDPILYFDDVVLYESELEDNGVSTLSVKIRVMPKCWYVLVRFYMRVDKVAVRLREVRLFSDVSSGFVLRKTQYQEGRLDGELRGLSTATLADGDEAAVALQALAPVGLKLLKMEKLSLPLVG